jgi:hypothetical protein
MPEIDDMVLRRPDRRNPAACPALAAIGATLLAGCAQSLVPEPIQPVSAMPAHVEMSVCRREPAEPTPQSAPACAFWRSDIKTMDPERWARLRTEYERQCYQEAERTLRERLNRLLANKGCES